MSHGSRSKLFLAVLIGVLALSQRTNVALGQSSWYTGDDPQLVQAVEVGYNLPAQNIVYVTSTPATFTFTIWGGDATFVGGSNTAQVTVSSPGWLVEPEIVPGPLADESIVSISAASSGAPMADNRSVYATDAAGISEMFTLVPPPNVAYLDTGSHHYVIDLRLVTNDTGIDGQVEGDNTEFSILPLMLPPKLRVRSDSLDSLSGVCIRTPLKPGKVFWDFSRPREDGKYSILPEGSSCPNCSLQWAAGSQQDVDGIYRCSWGCGKAFKVPDSCDLHVTNKNFSYWYCCNAAAWAAGKKLKWVNTRGSDPKNKEKDWPDCPLCE